ncbi:DegT/DnrJ/EryC1/StrS family aminotransferase [Marnyiella aurantia]|uniref:DegT/DnrJ/EryC1/StrS family aminotransferase n=1 Tax=Marnyiella aurantia TaxID=2758037 RepID=A0A7D7QTP6_9FLAO|nr:DegT/DnrJ/EryC1/StrS family aminotransferase [Marnyiella aurantia]MBA5247452.1 DegT/DnrJ/EryC1/StrS family aminotransferase [Marnyiella aurantia]QMS99208.1 DegT/DnrJ/EryC1/StrS family aminotransferase [Marnyiella aurantia]
MYKIPLFDLNFDEKEEQAALETIQSKWISTGPKTAAFEAKFAGMLSVKHAIALSNCTVSLHLALKLVGVEAGDEVICPSLTFVATVNAIRYVNAVPVFGDVVSYENPTISAEDIRKKITPKTKAIIVMHYGGFACDMDTIMAIAKEHDLKVIEDACHGPLAEYKRRKLGTIGDVGCFSFFSNKNISTGEGGMLITNNDDYAARTKLLRSHGMTSMSYERAKGHSTAYDVVELGYNYRMDDIHSSIGIVQLDKIQADLEKRAEVRTAYLNALNDVSGIIIPFADYTDFNSNYIFPIVLTDGDAERRDAIRAQLAEAGIQTSMHYPAVHHFSIYQEFASELPVTDFLVDHLITLPMYSKLTVEQVNYISETLKKLI